MKKQIAAAALGAAVLLLSGCSAGVQEASGSIYAMSTIVSQRVWAQGDGADKARLEAEQTLNRFEAQFSLYREDSEIALLNAAAGIAPVHVSEGTYRLLEYAKELSLQHPQEFALTIAPVTLAWGVNTDAPRVLGKEEREALLPLIQDEQLVLERTEDACTAFLEQPGQGVDLGGIAKGAACDAVREVYRRQGVQAALLDIGGNIMAYGRKPDGSAFEVGLRDPQGGQQSAMGVLRLEDQVVAVSGGYERFFEVDGERYSHIFDPKTAAPAQSNLEEVAVISSRGTDADFYSTTLYVGGLDQALRYMRQGGCAIAVTKDGTVYASQSLQGSFRLTDGGAEDFRLEWVGPEETQ